MNIMFAKKFTQDLQMLWYKVHSVSCGWYCKSYLKLLNPCKPIIENWEGIFQVSCIIICVRDAY